MGVRCFSGAGYVSFLKTTNRLENLFDLLFEASQYFVQQYVLFYA